MWQREVTTGRRRAAPTASLPGTFSATLRRRSGTTLPRGRRRLSLAAASIAIVATPALLAVSPSYVQHGGVVSYPVVPAVTERLAAEAEAVRARCGAGAVHAAAGAVSIPVITVCQFSSDPKLPNGATENYSS